jgi:hypothetical protein
MTGGRKGKIGERKTEKETDNATFRPYGNVSPAHYVI